MAHHRRFSGHAIDLGRWGDRRSYGQSPNKAAPSQHAAMQLLIIATAILVIPAAWLLSSHLILPATSFAALAMAGMSALVAWHWRVAKDIGSLNLWDAAGVFALIGFGACMLSEPLAVMQLFEAGDPRPNGALR